VNGDPIAISSSGESRQVVVESSFVVGRGTGSTTDYRLDATYYDCPFEASWSWYLSSQPVGLIPGDEHQLVNHDSVVDGMHFGYCDGFAALYTSMDNSDGMIYVRQ
jgi:hypothetical protein